MSEYEHKPESGSLFKNSRREKETHPHYNGSAKIAGVDYWVSAWINEKDGNKYMSLKFKSKEDSRVETTPAADIEELDEELGF